MSGNRKRPQDVLIRRALKRFGLEMNAPFEFLKSGRVANSVVVSTSRGRYIVRFYLADCQKEKLETGNIEFEVEVLQFLSGKIPAPVPIKLKDNNEVFCQIDSALIFAYKFLDGESIQQSDLNSQIAEKAGALLNDMIRASKDFHPKEASPPEGDIPYILHIAGEFKRREGDRLPPLFDEMVKDVSCLTFPGLDQTQKGIVDADFFFENLLVDQEGNYSVIDFGDAYYGYMLMDVVIGAMEFSVKEDHSWDLEMFKSFLRPLTSWLKENRVEFQLFKELLAANCLRFALYTLPGSLDEGTEFKDNNYMRRYLKLKDREFCQQLETAFQKVMQA